MKRQKKLLRVSTIVGLALLLAAMPMLSGAISGCAKPAVAPKADFIASPTSGYAPLASSFTDKSMGDYDTWEWDFGDGTTSTEQNPTHTYTTDGKYTVSLTVTGRTGSDTKTETNYIAVGEVGQITADFSATPRTIEAWGTVEFTDKSMGDYDTWEWDFGDGTTSTEQNPTHTYYDPGEYDVAFTVTGPFGTDTRTESGCIAVAIPGPFTWDVPGGSVGSATFGMSIELYGLVNPEIPNATLVPIAIGSEEVLRSMAAGEEGDAVYVTAFAMNHAWLGTGPYAERPLVGPKPYQVFWTHALPFYFMAAAGRGISTYDDLAGKNVWPGAPGWTATLVWESMLKAVGIYDKVNLVYLGVGEVPDAMKTGRIDAVAVANETTKEGPVLAAWPAEIDLYNDLVALDMTQAQKDAIRACPGLGFAHGAGDAWMDDVGMQEIPAGSTPYGYQFGPHCHPYVIYQLVKTLHEHQGELEDMVNLYSISVDFIGAQARFIATAPDVPIHPGAARYYKEVGIWQDDWLEGEWIPRGE